MEWIGQQVYDFVATFRSGIIIDDINITTIQSSSESFADNDTSLMTSAAIEDKILSYGYSTGDITGVTITTDSGGGSAASDTAGSADFSILGSSGVGVTNSGTTITAVAVPAEIDHDSLNNYADDEHFTQANITTVGTIGTGVWQGTAIASAYLDSDTAHLSGTQSFTGDKTFEGSTVINKATFIQLDGDKSVTPGDGAMIHADTSTITDSNTSASGTAAEYNHVFFEAPTLAATNASVTTTDASVLKLGRMLSGTNQTLTNSWSLYAVGPISTAGLTNTGSYTQTSGDMTLYHAANDANPTFSIGSSATERLEIKAEYESGAQGLDVVKFITRTAGSSTNDARYAFQVDEEFIFSILDDGINIGASGNISIGGVDILDDASGTTTLKNIDALDATTESTIEAAIDTLSNFTSSTALTSLANLVTVGTIGTGVWQGTAIGTSYTKHLQHIDFQGYATGDGSNWEISKQVSVNTATFNHDTAIGSDGLTAMSVQTWMRAGGKVIPRDCTLKRIYGWSTCAGSSTANIGLFKFTPTRNSNINRSAVELADISYTAMGNTKMEDHDITSFTEDGIAAGDILFSALKSESGAIQYFTLTIEVEF